MAFVGSDEQPDGMWKYAMSGEETRSQDVTMTLVVDVAAENCQLISAERPSYDQMQVVRSIQTSKAPARHLLRPMHPVS